MSLVFRLAALGAIVSFASALPADAQNSATPTAKKKADPNEIVCEKQEVLGSRLATRRVCMTRSEWAERRRADRDLVARSQTNSCVRNAGC